MKRVLHMRFLLLLFLALGLMVDRIGPWNTVGALKQCLNRKASTKPSICMRISVYPV